MQSCHRSRGTLGKKFGPLNHTEKILPTVLQFFCWLVTSWPTFGASLTSWSTLRVILQFYDVSDAPKVLYDVSDAPEVVHDVSNNFLVIVTMWQRHTTWRTLADNFYSNFKHGKSIWIQSMVCFFVKKLYIHKPQIYFIVATFASMFLLPKTACSLSLRKLGPMGSIWFYQKNCKPISFQFLGDLLGQCHCFRARKSLKVRN